MKLYRCPLCGGHHEEPLCHRVRHFDRTVKEDEVPFVPTEVVDGSGWDTCTLCGGYARTEHFTVEPVYNGEMKICPGCGPWPSHLKCNGCGHVEEMYLFDWVKRAPYVRKWRCWECNSEDVEMTEPPKVKALIHECEDWVTFTMPHSATRAVMGGIMKHYIGRESVPLEEKFDFPKELQNAHHSAKCGHMKKVKYKFYSDGTINCEIVN